MCNLQALLASLGRLWQRPLGSLMSILVIAIALALPTGLSIVVNNLQRLSQSWEGAASATLFLKQELQAEQVETLLKQLRRDPGIGSIKHLDPDQALAEFRQYSGLGEAVSQLEKNPLPHVVLIRTANPHLPVEAFSSLLERIKALPEVETATADLQWMRRFQAMVHILQRTAQILSALLAMAVVLVIGNTIRLEIQHRRQEIRIIKLVGGSNAFIRRPFLYEGFWYGLLGSLAALLLVAASWLLLKDPVNQLSQLYGSKFALEGIPLQTAGLVLLLGCLLGVVGAWIAVHLQLAEIEPA
jgi:cell division transport system permease protein